MRKPTNQWSSHNIVGPTWNTNSRSATQKFPFSRNMKTHNHVHKSPVQIPAIPVFKTHSNTLLPSAPTPSKVKVKLTLEQATKDQRGTRYIDLLLL
jgi:hypothetical protein